MRSRAQSLILLLIVGAGCDGLAVEPAGPDRPLGKADDPVAGCAPLVGEPGMCRRGDRVFRKITNRGRLISVDPPDFERPPADTEHATFGQVNWELTELDEGLYLGSVCMMTNKVGFAVGGIGGVKGVVYRTVDGGDSWTVAHTQAQMTWHASCAAVAETGLVAVIGVGKVRDDYHSMLMWSRDAGRSWSDPEPLIPASGLRAWVDEIEFGSSSNALIPATPSFVTDSGGATRSDWQEVVPGDSWWMGFTFLPDGRVWLGGVGIVHSEDNGHTWRSLPAASPVFDGSIAIDQTGFGFTASGSIAPTVEGWVYRTYDGGESWSPQPLFRPTVPIRDIALVDDRIAVAAGGDMWSQAPGGIWTTPNGGDTWVLEVQTGVEFVDIEVVRGESAAELFVAGGNQIWHRHIDL